MQEELITMLENEKKALDDFIAKLNVELGIRRGRIDMLTELISAAIKPGEKTQEKDAE